MLPESDLFKRRQGHLQEQSGKLLRSAEMRKDINTIIDLLRDRDDSVSAPGLAEIRIAAQRELNADSIVFPKGKIYSSQNYDSFEMGNPVIDMPESPTMSYVSRMYAVTTEEERGKVAKKIEEWIDGPQKISSKAIIMTITPKDAGKVFDIDSALFVVVQATGGENYCYMLVPNDHIGKVIAQEAMEDEWGGMRDKFGYIDRCKLKAIPATPEESVDIAIELHKVSEFLEKHKPKVETKKERARRHIGTIGTAISTKLKSSDPIKATQKNG